MMGRRRRWMLCGLGVGESLTAEEHEARLRMLAQALRAAGVPDEEIAALVQALRA